MSEIDVLPQLFGRISIPQAVQNELIAEGASVQTWIAQAPDWLDIHVVSGEPDQMLERLQQTSFRASSTLLKQFLDRYRRGVDADG